MDDERGDGTQAVGMMEIEKKEKSRRWNEVDVVKEEAGYRDVVKHIEKSIYNGFSEKLQSLLRR